MRKSLLILAVLLMLAGAASAQHGGDIGLTIGAGRIVTNEINGSIFEPQRVFESELGEDVANFTDEPGYDSDGIFTPGSGIGFNILDALRKWDGSDFDEIPAETMTVAFAGGAGGNSRTTPPIPDTTVPGFTLSVGNDGSWHRHLQFTLNAPASAGIYLLELDMFSTQSSPALDNSLPYYLVFNQNDSEAAHEAAVSYVENNVVPEPSALALAAMGGLLALRRQRRRA